MLKTITISHLLLATVLSCIALHPITVISDTQTATELQAQLATHPEYAELSAQFTALTKPRTRAQRAAARPTPKALLSCLATIEKLEETYPSELLTNAATWGHTQLKPHGKSKRWKRNALIIGSTAAAAAIALAAVWHWKNNQSPTYPTENLIHWAPNETPHYKVLRHEVMTCEQDCKPEFVAQALHYKLLELEAEKLSPTILSPRNPGHPTREQEQKALEERLSKESQERVRTLARQDKAKFKTAARLLLRSQYISKDLQLKQMQNDLKTSSDKNQEAISAQIAGMRIVEQELQEIARKLKQS